MKKFKRIFAGICAAATAFSMVSAPVSAEVIFKGYRGDLNNDGIVSAADAQLLKNILIYGKDAPKNADFNADGTVDYNDLTALKLYIFNGGELNEIYEDISLDFITPSIKQTKASLPSQGDSKLVIFYIDFPDCTFSQKLSSEEIETIAFGEADENSPYYPFESMSAFYKRSSKGSMNLSGNVFSYTAKESISVYNDDKVKLVEECYEAFKDSVDFSSYDSDSDGKIDATLICVPESADSNYWWPCAGAFGDPEYSVDNVNVGHIITGYAVPSSHNDFNSSYLHEMGHCMGLPDYYLYSSDDFDSMHGTAGYELMDADAYSDFGAFSKLMLGWYRENQISVYDKSLGKQTYFLDEAQSENGNCVIIPYNNLDEDYLSEYFIIEYITGKDNNSGLSSRWQTTEDGIRIFHINAEFQRDYWYSYFKYQNGSEYTNNDDDGIRLIRLVNDGNGVFTSGDVINSSTNGFGWYDDSENESIDPGVSITIGELSDGRYSITIE